MFSCPKYSLIISIDMPLKDTLFHCMFLQINSFYTYMLEYHILLVIYFIVSFTTMAWHITWILFIINVLIEEIVKLIFSLKGGK
mgnify:CR=1 FL=1